MAKTYTAQEMRETAERFAFEEDSSRSNTIVAMLRQAADTLEREKQIIEEVSKVDAMKVALLDGHPMHQQTNAKRIAAIIEFFPKVKEIIGEVRPLEREKKYEYAKELPDGSISFTHFDEYQKGYYKFRRPVGEWEEVRDGE